MNLFLDSNIYLSFYRLSDDDLEELQKLTVAARSKDTILYVTDQVCDEFNRNRESVVAASLKTFEAARLPSSFPRLLMNYPDFEAMTKALTEYENHRNSLLQEVREAAAEKKLHADGIIEKLFKLARKVPMTEGIWTAARQRLDLGNPPGKDASYGDAVNWESLLDVVPDGEDLLFVTGDLDGLMAELVMTEGPATGIRRLTEWLAQNAAAVGKRYASEVSRHYRLPPSMSEHIT
jgi:hypothetical protein